jgi:two-component system NtrC family sensor kinase
VRLEIEPVSDLWSVETDVGELELALVNIAVNARDAMPQGGTLTVSARNASLEGDEHTLLTGDFVALSLTDTGEGIPPDVLARIFEPFFTTKDVGKGTGLGLSQVYGFARQSGGDVHVSSEPGKGTTVTLYLPRSQAAVVYPVVKGGDKEEIHGHGAILLVEDNPQVGDVSKLLLEQLGYDIVRADRPAAALDMLSGKNDFVLVFSDIVMPGDMDGLALARAIQERHPNLPVLLATGYSSAAERASAEFPILRKPYDQSTLGIAVKAALGGSGLKQPAPA